MSLLWRENPLNTWKSMGFTVCLDHPCQGHGQGNCWAIIVPEDTSAAGKDNHESFSEWGEDWESSKADPSHGSAFHFNLLMTEKEGFTSILKQRSLAAALACQQVSHQATPSKGIFHTAFVRWSFVSLSHLCASEEGAVLRKGSGVSSTSMQDSPKKDEYPSKEI